MRTIIGLLFFPLIVVLVGMIAFGEMLGVILVTIFVVKLCLKKKEK